MAMCIEKSPFSEYNRFHALFCFFLLQQAVLCCFAKDTWGRTFTVWMVFLSVIKQWLDYLYLYCIHINLLILVTF